MSTSVSITNVYLLQPAATALGLGPVSGEPNATIKLIQSTLAKNVGVMFAAQFPSATANTPQTGLMGPWDNSLAGTVPQCALDVITTDFQGWQLPTDTNTLNQMCKEITQHLASDAGEIGSFAGSTQIAGSVEICWCVGYALSEYGQANPPTMAVIYAYTASEAID